MAFLRLEDMFGERMSIAALRVLTQVEGGLSGNEIARRVGAQQSTVRKALERLVERGLVSRRNVGRSASYELDTRRAAVRNVVIPAFQAETELRIKLWSDVVSLASRLRPGPLAMVLFGSVVKSARAPRDIDLLIVTRNDAESARLRDQLAEAGEHFEAPYQLPLSPVFMSEERLAAGRREALLESVLRDGVLLYGEPSGILRKMRRWHRAPGLLPV